jgi:hypothetical protein
MQEKTVHRLNLSQALVVPDHLVARIIFRVKGPVRIIALGSLKFAYAVIRVFIRPSQNFFMVRTRRSGIDKIAFQCHQDRQRRELRPVAFQDAANGTEYDPVGNNQGVAHLKAGICEFAGPVVELTSHPLVAFSIFLKDLAVFLAASHIHLVLS